MPVISLVLTGRFTALDMKPVRRVALRGQPTRGAEANIPCAPTNSPIRDLHVRNACADVEFLDKFLKCPNLNGLPALLPIRL